ncbi:MAG TPA: class I SAM-dependent methyltransferase [Acidimicrobiales bacterium]|nr:class I SAM-dependent methyltransferase [Acidimicrobiales bacterium]
MSSRWQHTGAARGDDYDARWRALEASGHDPHGEVAFVMRFEPESVLDAGCGTGRVAIELARRGVNTVGVDLDPAMLDTAQRKDPQLEWVCADLASLDLDRRFDVVVMAGNVMIFVEPGTEARVVARMAAHLEPGGRLIAGFQLGQSLGLDGYDTAAEAAGLALEARYATWDGDPVTPDARYAVSVHRLPQL